MQMLKRLYARATRTCWNGVLGVAVTISLLASAPVRAQDTDIFTINQSNASIPPNVLIVLDNTSNWARNDQHFPGMYQGQAEVQAIQAVVNNLNTTVNLGVMEYVTNGTANTTGGYVTFAVTPVGGGGSNASNTFNLLSRLNTIYNNYNSPTEKINQGGPYGDLMYDAYNYFSGLSPSPVAPSSAVYAPNADSRAYATNYSLFKSPLSSSTACASTYIIFIGNPAANGPTKDSANNLTWLAGVGGDTSQLYLPNFTQTTSTLYDALGYSSECFANQPTGVPYDYSSTCSSGTYSSCSYSTIDTNSSLSSCSSGLNHYAVFKTGTTTTSSTSSSTLLNQVITSNAACSVNSPPGASCPASTTSTTYPSSGTTVVTTTSYSSCSYASTTTSCGGNKQYWNLVGTVTTNTTTTTTSTVTNQNIGASGCSSSASSCNTAAFPECASGGCSCSGGPLPPPSCQTGSARYQALGAYTGVTETATGTSTLDTATYNADEWARFMYQKGIPVSDSANQHVRTYTIDVYHDQPNAVQTSLLTSMARNGGGKYFNATNEQAIVSALNAIFSEILAANSAFSSASLPISATNKAQNGNEVYIGMFRPDTQGLPRWFGNLKRYQLANFSTGVDLADFNGNPAVSATTGFIAPCAQSWWTTDSGNAWANVSGSSVTPRVFFTSESSPGISWTTVGDDTLLAQSQCLTAGVNPYSDIPDGPIVEKGGAAERLRMASSRNMLTLSGNSLVPFNTTNVTASTNTVVNQNIVNFIDGQDVTGEINATASNAWRPSIHGDVVHSRPLPIDYGGSTGVYIYYGANDGAYHAVQSSTGNESWSFVAPEEFSGLQRLLDNAPVISSSSTKPYYFDGSTGVFTRDVNNDGVIDTAWIYPSMRRGGRMVYGFDVSTPGSPAFKWKVGCPNQGNDTGCSNGFSQMGQTWSTPNATYLTGYSTTTPVVIIGGGYDTCEDQDTLPSSTTGFCSNPKGNIVYVVDSNTGNLLNSFSTDRSVAADITLVDINQDGKVDAAYVADTGGNLYRIDFSDTGFVPLAPSNWSIHKVAYTNGSNRKFLFAPAAFPYKGKVYLAIGSGDREHPLITNYPYEDNVINRFYVYLDDPTRSTATNLDGPTMYNRTSLEDATCSASKVLPNNAMVGWYMDLTAGQGEQVVTSALITTGLVTFSTNMPLNSSNSCNNVLGQANGYWVNLLTGSGAIGSGTSGCGGTRYAVFTGGGLPPSPVSAVVNIGGVAVPVVIGAAKLQGGASSAVGGQQVPPLITPVRKQVFWEFLGGDSR